MLRLLRFLNLKLSKDLEDYKVRNSNLSFQLQGVEKVLEDEKWGVGSKVYWMIKGVKKSGIVIDSYVLNDKKFLVVNSFSGNILSKRHHVLSIDKILL